MSTSTHTSPEFDETVVRNLAEIKRRIHAAASSVGRDPGQVKLVVVTKGHGIHVVRSAINAGALRLGENYAEEGVEKILAAGTGGDVEWHMIGHVQSRKAQLVCEHFHLLHSLDSVKLAIRLDHFAGEQGRRLPVLLECNVSGEVSKYGFPAWQPEQVDGLRENAAQIAALPNLQVLGLMTIAPFFDDPELARPYFKRLAALQTELVVYIPDAAWNELSMGMSADFEVAVQEGATYVRIGQAILGPRG
jgi:hypothetical protein